MPATHTINRGGKYFNVPAEFGKRRLTRGDAQLLFEQGRIKAESEHQTLEEAQKAGGYSDEDAHNPEKPKKKKSIIGRIADSLAGN